MPAAVREDEAKVSKPQLLVVSAKSQEALFSREQSLLKYMSLHPSRSSDLAYTLGVRREHLSHRGFLINTKGIAPEMGAIKYSIAGRAPDLIYVFTGQGAQWAGMGRGLMKSFESFRENIQALDTVLQKLERPPSWSLEGKHAHKAVVASVFEQALTESHNSRTCGGQYRSNKHASAFPNSMLCIADRVGKSPG